MICPWKSVQETTRIENRNERDRKHDMTLPPKYLQVEVEMVN
jgi:hypothetical protein